jgi:hypothetical protein
LWIQKVEVKDERWRRRSFEKGREGVASWFHVAATRNGAKPRAPSVRHTFATMSLLERARERCPPSLLAPEHHVDFELETLLDGAGTLRKANKETKE